MGGFLGESGIYSLTWTQAMRWHRFREDACESLGDVVKEHVEPAGFTATKGRRGSERFVLVSGPGLAEGYSSELWLAVSGADPGKAKKLLERWYRWR
jgi:hypothetical protein